MSSDKYNHTEVENRIYSYWVKNELFKPKKNKKKFSIVIPPPNVTGSLHMGHALNNSIQDLLTRYHRMNNFETLWQPGTDHAGIATQALVEKKLEKDGINKKDLGRDNFIKKVWEWKSQYGDIILNQLKKLGCSCDWSRNAFTMDDNLSDSVLRVFVELHKKKIIYKSKKLVNWDTVLKTAISDLEVDQREVNSKLYYIKYPINGTNEFITIATTRPETMLGDTAVAVNPKDKRFKKYKNKDVDLPLVDRKIKIIFDNYADPEQGTGAVKITPAHDFNDYDVGQRNKLQIINIFTEDGKINNNCPKKYQGLDRFEARKLILEDLKNLNLFVKEENIKNKVPYGDRSNSVIEPYLTEQWFADAKKLSIKAKKIVKSKRTNFFPENWSKTYFQWMNNIEPWCISRQLWWGHQIPAWYGPDKKIFVSENEDDVKQQAKKHYGKDVDLTRDPDVLDTWFSSGLWPFATLGWPDDNKYVDKFYPTSVLVTGFDIIFFWVARMMMMSLEFTDQIPFKDVYVTGLIRDENGQKMSKSKGNVIDPLDLIYGISQDDLVEKRTSNLMQEGLAQKIEKKTRNQFPKGIESYGTDALRMTFFSLATHTKDISFELGRLKGFRNFCTKIWNAARFIDGYPNEGEVFEAKNDKDKWIYNEFNITKSQIEKNITDYRLDFAINEVYEFFWNKFCDVYIEECKKSGQTANLRPLLKEILHVLHPFAPFITEEISELLFKERIIN